MSEQPREQFMALFTEFYYAMFDHFLDELASEEESENESLSEGEGEEDNQSEVSPDKDGSPENLLGCTEDVLSTPKDLEDTSISEGAPGGAEEGTLHYAERFANCLDPNDESLSPTMSKFIRFFLSTLVEGFKPKKPFSGNPLEWTEFWPTFETYFNLAAKLTSQKPLVFLKRHIIGEAGASIMAFTGDEYKQAITVLKEKYGKPEIIEEACMKYVSDMPKLESNVIGELGEFCRNINRNLHYFAVYKDRRTVYSEQLAKGLLSKLPDALHSKIFKGHKSSTLTLEELMDELLRELRMSAVPDLDSLLGF